MNHWTQLTLTRRALATARNSVAHVGEVPEELTRQALRSMARLVSELATALRFDDDFWDDEYRDIVGHLMDESLTSLGLSLRRRSNLPRGPIA